MKVRNKRFKALLVAAEKAGWSIGLDGKSHIRMLSPDGKHRVSFSATKNDLYHGYENVRAALRRAGLNV